MDLDETIVHCPLEQAEVPERMYYFSLDDPEKTRVLVRPHFIDFVRFIVARFDEVHVFTAAQPSYATQVVAHILRQVATTVWTYGDCEVDLASGSVFKSLRDKTTASGPLDTPYTVVIDDRPEVCHKNHFVRPGTHHYAIPQFLGDPLDTGLQNAIAWLETWLASVPPV